MMREDVKAIMVELCSCSYFYCADLRGKCTEGHLLLILFRCKLFILRGSGLSGRPESCWPHLLLILALVMPLCFRSAPFSIFYRRSILPNLQRRLSFGLHASHSRLSGSQKSATFAACCHEPSWLLNRASNSGVCRALSCFFGRSLPSAQTVLKNDTNGVMLQVTGHTFCFMLRSLFVFYRLFLVIAVELQLPHW